MKYLFLEHAATALLFFGALAMTIYGLTYHGHENLSEIIAMAGAILILPTAYMYTRSWQKIAVHR